MIRSFLKGVLNRALGRAKPTPTAPARPPRPPAPRPVRPAEPQGGHDHGHDHGGGGHDHGHDHGGGGHDHGHDHGGGGHDHGHDHGGGGHDHGHDHGGAAASRPAPAPKVHVWASETPNPHAMKFATNVQVVELGALSFNSAEEATKHPLGRALWAIEGVAGVFAVRDFVTVTRTPEVAWDVLTPRVSEALVAALEAR